MKIKMSEITILNDQINMREDALLWNVSEVVTVLNNRSFLYQALRLYMTSSHKFYTD